MFSHITEKLGQFSRLKKKKKKIELLLELGGSLCLSW